MTVAKSLAVVCFAGLVSVEVALTAQGRGIVTAGPELRAPLEMKTVKGAPYSAQVAIESTQILADGNRIVQRSNGRVYRDTEGRVRREEDRANASPSVSIVDPVAGVSYWLDVENRVAWKTPGAAIITMFKSIGGRESQHVVSVESLAEGKFRTQQAEVAAAKMAGRPLFDRADGIEQHRDEQLEPQTVEGVRASGHRRTTTIAAGAIGNELPITIVSEEWTSPDLQVLVMTHRSDPRSGESSYKLLNIVRTEPDAYLFQVPADFAVKDTAIHKMER
jgi:hypothetical protein